MRLPISSADAFARHFSERNLQEVIDLHLREGVARGVDGTSYDKFLASRDSEVNLIRQRALSGAYKFSPYRQKLLLKNASSPPRQVSIPTLRDRVALRALNNFLTSMFPDCRPQHAHPVISAVIQSIESMRDDDCFIKLDIQSFYDAVSHNVLMRNLRARIRTDPPLTLISSALRTPTGTTVAENASNDLGIPQGLSISNMLSSIYLKSIDSQYGQQLGLKYHRYVDDILCILPRSEADLTAAAIIKSLKSKKKLTCHPLGTGKSQIIEPGFSASYLGYSISRRKISVRTATEKKLMSNIMEIIHGAKPAEWQRAMWRVNLRITGCKISGANVGWIFYFSQINDLSLLAKMDTQIKAAVIARLGEQAASELKRLLKAYHQAKFNHQESTYYPDFGTYTRQEMERHLELLAPERYRNLAEKTDAQITRIFGSSVWREVKRMERDTLGSFS
ncbi:reverse transcriptase domain-containing protein [Halovulum sp. GXIMD14794]